MKRKNRKKKDTAAAARALADFIYALHSEEFCDALCNEIIWWGNAFNSSYLALQGKDPLEGQNVSIGQQINMTSANEASHVEKLRQADERWADNLFGVEGSSPSEESK